MKLSGTNQRLVCADDINVLGGGFYTIKENAESLVVASKNNGLEVNADQTKYMVMSRDQDAGRNHNIKTDSISFEWVKDFRCLGNFNESKFCSGRN